MPRRGNNIYHRKDGRWEGRFVKGRTQSRTLFGYVYGRTYGETRNKRMQAIQEWKLQENTLSKYRASLNGISVGWLRSIRVRTKESTVAKYEEYLQYYVLPAFGKMDMSKLTNGLLSSFFDELLQKGGRRGEGLAPSTVAGVLFVLKQLRKFALRQGFAVGFSDDFVTIRLRQKPIRVLTLQEQKRLQEYLIAHPSRKHLGILLCLFTGLRVGELCALRYDDISLREKKLMVSKTVRRIRNPSNHGRTMLSFAKPKSTDSDRIIPLTDEICTFIRPVYEPGTYFLTGRSDQCLDPRTMQRCFSSVLSVCGIDQANFHVLRHTFATRWIDAGLDPKSLSSVLGHATANITLNRYVHPSLETKRHGMRRLEEFLSRSISHQPSGKRETAFREMEVP